MMGAMLGRFKKCVIGLPGGCPLGPRPIDQHIKGFKALGAEIDESNDTSMKIETKELHGANIFLDMVSVGNNQHYVGMFMQLVKQSLKMLKNLKL